MPSYLVFACAALIAVAGPAGGQQVVRDSTGASLRIFLDCDACDDDYVRTETRWAEFVRDRTVADVHVLVTQIGTGGGGSEFTIEFIGVGRFSVRADTARYLSQLTQTSDERRRGLTRAIHLGLAPFAARTDLASRLRLSLEGEDDDERERPAPANDRWKGWVFETEVNGSAERESKSRDANFGGSFAARRITSLWKSGFELSGDREDQREDVGIDEDEPDAPRIIKSRRESYFAGAVVVRSLGAHWGAGAQATVGGSSFENTRIAYRAAPAVEYSIWPYADATRRQLTLQYSLGVSSFQYRDTTVFGRVQETRPTQSFVIGYDTERPWGTAEADFQYSNYPDKPSQYRLEFDIELDWRLARGLSLDVSASASSIHDQLSIRKGNASLADILLRLRERQTEYRLQASIGLSYTFGSIFNSVVNPRFGGGPGQLLR